MNVPLSESELERARRIADIRNSKNGQVPNYRETRQHSDWEIHYAGVRGEMAVCKVVNFPIDRHFSYNGDNGAPDAFYNGRSIEVKTPLYYPPILKFNSLTDLKADVAALCYAPKSGSEDEGVITIAGVVSREKFIRDHYIRDFGYGPRHCFNADEMVSFEDFLKMEPKK